MLPDLFRFCGGIYSPDQISCVLIVRFSLALWHRNPVEYSMWAWFRIDTAAGRPCGFGHEEEEKWFMSFLVTFDSFSVRATALSSSKKAFCIWYLTTHLLLCQPFPFLSYCFLSSPSQPTHLTWTDFTGKLTKRIEISVINGNILHLHLYQGLQNLLLIFNSWKR